MILQVSLNLQRHFPETWCLLCVAKRNEMPLAKARGDVLVVTLDVHSEEDWEKTQLVDVTKIRNRQVGHFGHEVSQSSIGVDY